MEAAKKRLPDWAFWLACVAPFLGFWTYGLFDLDEGFYGAVVVDMIRRNDWITPTLNGAPWFEKPILAYWLAIPSVQLFGEAVGPRLPSVLCTFATMVVLYRFAKRHLDVNVARLTALVYATNLLVVGIGRMMMTDAPLVLCLTLAMTTMAGWRMPLPAPDKAGWKVWTLVGLFVGLGILAKGPVALILFGGTFLFASLLVPGFRGVWKSAWPLGLAVAGGVLATWYVPCYLANGQAFIQKFLVEQNVGRFAGGDTAHNVPPLLHPVYYPAILLLSLLPWIVFSGASLLRTSQTGQTSQPGGESKRGTDVNRYLWIWALVPLGFFSLSGTKLPHYILPAVPPLAVLVSATLLRVRGRWPWEHVGLAWSACVFVVAQYTYTSIWNRRMSEVQIAAKYVRQHRGRLVVYKIGATQEPASALELRETSHPSILFYLHDTAVVSDDPRVMRATQYPYYVLTTRDNAAADPDLRGLSVLQLPGVERHALLQTEKHPKD